VPLPLRILPPPLIVSELLLKGDKVLSELSGNKSGVESGVPVVARLMVLEKVMVFVGGVLLLEFAIADSKLVPSVTGYVAAFKMEQEVKQTVVVSRFFQDIELPYLSYQC
jgi:hypothetical protein